MIKASRYLITPLNIVISSFVDLGSPKSITYLWNFGRLLGIILIIQIFTGLFLSFYYISDTSMAFNSVVYIIREVNYGWLFRVVHANGARLFFLVCYAHIGRGIYYGSYRLTKAWISGRIIYILLIATGFLGYVLPWGQISLWGAIVITNLISVIPFIGTKLVQWIWGGYRIGNSTLNCFYSLHYLVPFIILIIVIFHIIWLHISGSRSPVGIISNYIKVKFDLFFSIKDIINIIILLVFILLTLMFPFSLIESENFVKASPLNSPIHIVPEWYFLFIYAILRAVPNKIGGVLALCGALVCIFLLSQLQQEWKTSINTFYKCQFWLFVRIFLMLTWLGGQPVETPYIFLGQISTILYFTFFILEYYENSILHKLYSY
jgi:ubiquinol-cytochrome c reductase cytochrome b subunit